MASLPWYLVSCRGHLGRRFPCKSPSAGKHAKVNPDLLLFMPCHPMWSVGNQPICMQITHDLPCCRAVLTLMFVHVWDIFVFDSDVLVKHDASDVKGMNFDWMSCINVDAPCMQDADDHHSRSSTHSHGHAPSVAAAAEAGTTDAAQLPEKLPVDPGTSTNSLVNSELSPEQLLEQLPVTRETADIAQPDGELPGQLPLDHKAAAAISRSQLPLDSGDDDVAHKNSQLPGIPAKPENAWVSLC